MTTEITRAQVYAAISKSHCFVPDFTTREKTALTWNKVYISIQEGNIRFVELNFLQRIIRYLAGSLWYADTIFTDKTSLEKVKEYVHGIKTEPVYHNLLVMDLLSKAQTTSDFICLQQMVGNCSEQNGFSEGFLSESISLARQNLKMGMNITKVLDSLNKALLHEILGLTEEDYLPSRQIRVPYEIKNVFEEGIEKANRAIQDIGSPQTLVSYLKALGALEKINKHLENLPEALRPFLTQESGKQIVQDLRDTLILNQAHPSLIKAYLEDEQQIVNRLCYHAGLESTSLSRQVKDRMKEYRAAVVKELDAKYQVAEVDSQNDSFSASCNRYQKSTKTTWREQIADEIFRDAELTKVRIEEDKRGFTLDEYSQWIKNPQSPIGLPELKILSKITGRPVVIVKQVVRMSFYFEWVDGINLDLDQKPIILNEIKKGIWGAVEPIQATATLI